MNTTNFIQCNNKAQKYISDIRLDVENAINLKLSVMDPLLDNGNLRYKLIDNDRSNKTLKELDSLGCDCFIFDTVKQKTIGTLDYKLISSKTEITLELYQYSSNNRGCSLKEGWTIDKHKVTDIIAYIGYIEGVRTVFLVDYYDLRNYVCRNIEHYLNLATQQTIKRNVSKDSRSKTVTKCIKYSLKIDSKTFNDILRKCQGVEYTQGMFIEYADSKKNEYFRLKKQVKKEDRIKVSNL